MAAHFRVVREDIEVNGRTFLGINQGIVIMLVAEKDRPRVVLGEKYEAATVWNGKVGMSPYLDTYTNACYLESSVPLEVTVYYMIPEVSA